MASVKLLLTLTMVAAGAAQAQDPVKWSVTPHSSGTFKAGEKFSLDLTAHIDSGWHIYSVTQGPGGPFPTRIALPEGQAFRLAGAVTEPPPRVEMDLNFGIKTETYAGDVVFQAPVLVAADAPGAQQVKINVRYQACDESNCLPPRTDKLTAPVTLVAGGVVQEQPSGRGSLMSFLWLSMSMGALSLLTPCVFPMVPITVSYFASHAAARRSLAIRDAAVYALGIILTFTALGVALAALFGAAGINRFAASPWVNLAITAIFLAFAMSLFGAFELGIPSRVLTRLDAATRDQESRRIIGLLLMGLTFSLTSFTCTAPFVGTLLVMAAQGQRFDPIAGMLAFSTVFALPFAVLALAPQLVARLPKAGGWLNSVKVIMGLLEVAAAMKFLSNVDLIWRWNIFTRDTVLAFWIAIGILGVVYILGYFRMAHDSPVVRVSALRLVTAMIFLAITIALIPGVFGRRLGELESFLPPAAEEMVSGGTAQAGGEAGWIVNDYEGAREQARREQKLVFVNFTGYTCTNCGWMEANMFPRPEVAKELGKFVRLRLYTDGEGEIYERYQKMQQEKFGTVALPFYAILRPDGSIVQTYPGLTRNNADFLHCCPKQS